MRRARLLHSPEVVEILSLDTAQGIATIRRQGFIQKVLLKDLVWEEPPSALALGASKAPLEISYLRVSPRFASGEVSLEIGHNGPYSAFYVLYLRQGTGLWQVIWQGVLAAGEICTELIRLADYPPPWELRLQRLSLPTAAVPYIDSPLDQVWHIRYADFTRGTPWQATLASSHPSLPSAPPPRLSPESPPSYPAPPKSTPAEFVDLHIEKLAPQLKEAEPEVIFAFQVRCMENYLHACAQNGRSSTIVIHGVGRKKLREALLRLCAENGWAPELLLIPPYKGGATRVHFKSG
ncbi:MAG: hypothetical protein NZ958_01710 [Bacteroidia bacterium]|nr:hypothetical protein [Bacteroidia bacterium]MDW8089059.1 hypothetical protein [Bacteroidia bacterium]